MPIVADKLGTLYNKQAIIEYLLDIKLGEERYGDADTICPHIQSVKVIILSLLLTLYDCF